MSKEIDLNRLTFDPKNPRLPHKFYNQEDESLVIDYMIRHENIIELMKSISITGYSDAEPLLVVPNQDNFIVVEGNRRLAALKLLSNPKLAKIRINTIKEVLEEAEHRPSKIPCIVYEERSDILDYLGYRHITGVKDWGPLEKARYLDQLYSIYSIDRNSTSVYSKLAKMIGSKSDYVAKLHTSLKLYEVANDSAFFDTEITDNDIDFSWIPTAIGYKGIREFIGLERNSIENIPYLNSENLKKIFIWLFDPKKKVVPESRQISQLAKVTEHSEAIEKLKVSGSLDEALLYTSAPKDLFIELLKKSKESLRQAKNAIEQLSEKPKETDNLLEEILKLHKSIEGGIEANFTKKNYDQDWINSLLSDPDKKKKLEELLEGKD